MLWQVLTSREYNISNEIINKLQLLIFILSTIFSINLSAQTFRSESSIKEYWKTNGMDKIEGIYESSGTDYNDIQIPCKNINNGQVLCYQTWRHYTTKYKIALVKSKSTGDYKLFYLSGIPKGAEKVNGCLCTGQTYMEPENNQWRIGDVKAILYKTATTGLYKCDWYMQDKSLNPDAFLTYENHAYFNLMMSATDSKEEMYLKLYPTADDNITPKNKKSEQSSGTGFAISPKGFIVTNYHVTKGATNIKVRGINGDFSNLYTAKIVIEDKKNDLSIIQIIDSNFTSLGLLPYIISKKSSDVGNSVFALGYPLKAIMGDEIKLNNGIISSNSGFQGDITSYQISVPLQPGNSGGPLFDTNGNLIGIVNAKLLIGENVSYAIKSSYLLNLIDQLPSPLTLQSLSNLAGKPLTTQVKVLKKFVYVIEIN